MNFAKRAVNFISDMYVRRPLTMNTLTMCSLYSAGDCIQQRLEHHSHHAGQPYRHDWLRMVRMGTVGAIMGPFNHYWYVWLDRVVPAIPTFKYVGRKVLIDQSIFAPFCTIAFFTLFGTFEGKTKDQVVAELKEKVWPTYLVDCMVWPFAQTVNFFFLPSHLRVLYVSTLTLGWNVFLSRQKHYDAIDRVEAKEETGLKRQPTASARALIAPPQLMAKQQNAALE
eukprot:comp10331_c0_seq1/m.5132 comp10331_c0_seq1/g.5132  ORF comp10331_c0_seq1/g.5132 comp10331_c0_seq1/m.5132 type:complete len:225 (-) comp10331_c0_seq1:355-1029(-)